MLKKQLQAAEEGQLSRAEEKAFQKWKPEDSMGRKVSKTISSLWWAWMMCGQHGPIKEQSESP